MITHVQILNKVREALEYTLAEQPFEVLITLRNLEQVIENTLVEEAQADKLRDVQLKGEQNE